ASLLVGLVPSIVLQQSSGDWRSLLANPDWLLGIGLQVLALPAIVGLSAVQEVFERGGGTPFPYDPPRRVVTRGIYPYVRNPMQMAGWLVPIIWGALLGSGWVAASGLIALAYGIGLAGWDEQGSLKRRYGPDWTRYCASVRPWLPRWRPYWPAGT